MRSYLLAGNTRHYDGVITALEARGLRVLPAFASGLDNRPAVERFFMHEGRPAIDALVSLTGFSLVGGPAYNDARAAEDLLACGVDAASSLAVGQCRFSSVQASANQFEPIAIASWWSFISTTGRPTAFGENRSEVEAPRPFE